MGKATVIVLGGGFAGLSAAGRLARRGGRRVRVVLVDRKPFSEFNPLWPDLISARIQPASVRYDLASFCGRYGIEFVQSDVLAIDPSAAKVQTQAGELAGEFVICCLGAMPNYFGRDDYRQRTLSLTGVEATLQVRQRACELLAGTTAGAKAGAAGGRCNLLVVGGGYTGLETASHLTALMARIAGPSWPDRARVIVLEKLPRVLSTLPPEVGQWAQKYVEGLGVEVRTELTVEAFEPGDDRGRGSAVRLSDQSVLDRAMVVWSAGVLPSAPADALDVPRKAGRRLAVDATLRAQGCERLFVAGDAAGPMPPGHQLPLRQGVQFSLAGGRCAADNVLASLTNRIQREFDPADPGYVVPLAARAGVGHVLGLGVRGRLPAMLHYMMSAFRSWGWRNRGRLMRDLLLSTPPLGDEPAQDG